MESSETAVHIQAINKSFGDTHVLKDVSLEIPAGEFVTILGPSGCGKTTLLRLLAGLLDADRGQIVIHGRVVTDPAHQLNVPSEHRGVGLVFQDYALWPHMTVRQHLQFPLDIRQVKGEKAAARIKDLLQLVRLAGLEDRSPGQLSGGQQQRVALARALAAEVPLLLLDEPLSNLDARLRQEMREEILQIVRRSGVTGIAVTHDQADALAMSDRIVVMHLGEVLQNGTPQQVFEEPANATVAQFMGSGSVVPGVLAGRHGADGLAVFQPAGASESFASLPSEESLAGPQSLAAIIPVRLPERYSEGPMTRLSGIVTRCRYAGREYEYLVALPGGHLVTTVANSPAETGSRWEWDLPARAIRVVPAHDYQPHISSSSPSEEPLPVDAEQPVVPALP